MRKFTLFYLRHIVSCYTYKYLLNPKKTKHRCVFFNIPKREGERKFLHTYVNSEIRILQMNRSDPADRHQVPEISGGNISCISRHTAIPITPKQGTTAPLQVLLLAVSTRCSLSLPRPLQPVPGAGPDRTDPHIQAGLPDDNTNHRPCRTTPFRPPFRFQFPSIHPFLTHTII